MYFKEEIEYLKNSEEANNKRQLVNQSQLNFISEKYPNIPTSYLNYLSEIGYGSIMNCQFNIYNNLTDISDLGLDSIYSLPYNIKLFGDNFSGDFAGFDLSKNQLERPNQINLDYLIQCNTGFLACPARFERATYALEEFVAVQISNDFNSLHA